MRILFCEKIWLYNFYLWEEIYILYNGFRKYRDDNVDCELKKNENQWLK